MAIHCLWRCEMKLTTELVRPFIGGQAEIQNPGEGYVFRGEVEAIVVEDGELKIRFVWLAKGRGYPPIPTGWDKEDRLDYAVSLRICQASNIGPSGSDVGGDDRISLLSHITGETVVLYPPNGSKLDPAQVEGLELA